VAPHTKSRFIRLLQRAVKPLADGSPRLLCDQARDAHHRGEFEEASRLFQNLLETNPEDAEVCYRFGNLLKDQGALERSLGLYGRAIELKPDYSQAHCNRAVVLGLLNRHTEALEGYDRAIGIDSTDSIAHCNRAILLAGTGRKDSALAGFEAAIEHDANNFAALFGRAAILQERRQWAAAFAAYQRAIAVNPHHTAAHYNLAVVAKELKRWDEALASCQQALTLNPQLPDGYAKRAEILQELGQYAAALTNYDHAIALNPGDAKSLSNRGVIRQSMGDLAAALADYEHAIEREPLDPDTWFNRGTVLEELEDPAAALASYDRALELRPDFAAACVNRGTALQNQSLIREAVASYHRAIALDPDLPEAHYNLALASLALGDYEVGWREYEWRWRARGGPIFRERREFAEPLWLGRESIAGKTVLLYAEQGLGDCLHFCRYVERVAKLGPRIILEVPASLTALAAALPGVGQVVAHGQPLPPFDLQCPLMSLPLAFGTTLETIPSAQGYLKGDPIKMSQWLERLGAQVRPRVGLTWSGNQARGTNRKRHFALSRLIPHLPDGFDYFCLQTDVVAPDRKALESSNIFHFGAALHDFSDTAALCACMDLVISIDTSVAHLAGAMGKRTWVLLASVADWRWLTDRDDSPWYRSVRLFRQPSDGAWEEVFERVAYELRAKVAQLSLG